jgi:hypothetical protein
VRTPVAIGEVIRRVRKAFVDSGRAPSFYQINNGQCDEFAMQVLSECEGREVIREFYTEELQLADGSWDWACLRAHHGIIVPAGLSEAELDDIGFGGHVFLKHDGKWYDAECPNGADSPFDLPIFRRPIIAALRRKGLQADEVITEDVVPAPLCKVPNPTRHTHDRSDGCSL